MKIACPQESLAQGLAVVSRAVAPRSTMPVLSNILLVADEGRLKLAATNLDLGITSYVENVDVREPGSITVPSRLLGEFVNSLPKGNVEMALNQRTSTLNLRCTPYEANIKGIAAEEFPPIPQVDGQDRVSLDPEMLAGAIEQVAFAAATDDSRPALSGVLLSFRGTKLTLAAADGFRLAVRTLDLSEGAPESLDIIVPARTLQELGRVLGDQSEPVEVAVTPNRSQVLFHLKKVELVSRLIEATFPNYQQIIPTTSATRVTVNTKDFLNATRIASFFARDSSNIIRLQITPAKEELAPGQVLVMANTADVGDTVGGIDASIEGDATQIAFNSKYLSDVLGVLDTEKVKLELTSASRPGVLRPIGEEGYTHVIMPMHVTTPTRSG